MHYVYDIANDGSEHMSVFTEKYFIKLIQKFILDQKF